MHRAGAAPVRSWWLLLPLAFAAWTLIHAPGASVVLRLRNRTYRRIHDAENTDVDGAAIPDVYQQPPGPAGRGVSASPGDAGEGQAK